MKASVTTFVTAAAAVVVFATPPLALAQAAPHDHTQPSAVSNPIVSSPSAPSEQKPGMKMQGMKMDEKMADGKMAEKMAEKMAGMKAAKERIDGLMARLKAAEGAARVDVMTELITALVERHETMCQEMMSGHAAK